jgi:hypothetical protein
MKVIAVAKNERPHDSKTISWFHYYMFHGMWDAENLKTVNPRTGEQRTNLMRNGRFFPPIVEIHNNFYVTEELRRKLAAIPGVTFTRANWTRLVDYPFAKGDFSFYESPFWRDAERLSSPEDFFDGFLRRLPDVPDYQRTAPPVYRMEATPHFIAEEVEPKAKRHSFSMPQAGEPSVRVRLSPRTVQAYPVTWDMCHFFAEDVFRLIENDFDWDFFVRAERELKGTS